jgi:hypothetical protein
MSMTRVLCELTQTDPMTDTERVDHGQRSFRKQYT